MARGSPSEATGILRMGSRPQLNYYNKVLTELYMQKSMADVFVSSSFHWHDFTA